MKINLKRHIRRFGWAYALVVVLALARLGTELVRESRWIDKETVRRQLLRLDEQVMAQYGPSAPREARAKLSVHGSVRHPNLHSDPRFRRIMALEDYAPALEPEYAALESAYGDWLAEMTEAMSLGHLYQPFGEAMELARPDQDWVQAVSGYAHESNLLIAQTVAQLHCRLARYKVAHRDWDAALEHLRDAGIAGEVLMPASGGGPLIAFAIRTIAYSSYEMFLEEDVPVEVQRRALEQLNRLRASEPAMDESIAVRVNANWIVEFLQRDQSSTEFADGYRPFEAISNAPLLFGLGDSSRMLNDYPGILRYIGRLARSRPPQSMDDPYSIMQSWVENPALKQCMRRAARKIPAVRDRIQSAREALGEDTDSITLMLMNSGAMYNDLEVYFNRIHRSGTASTQGALMDIALRVHIQHAESGTWPDGIEELGLIAAQNSAGIFLKWFPITPEFRGELQKRFFPRYYNYDSAPLSTFVKVDVEQDWYQPELVYMNNKNEQPPADLKKDMRQVVGTNRHFFNPTANPILLYAMAQNLEANRLLTGDMDFYYQNKPANGQPLFYTPFEPLSPERARELTDAFDQRTVAEMPTDAHRPPDMQGVTSPDGLPNPIEFGNHAIDGTWRDPARILVAVSFGPDGDDDRGMVVYDPTNGTVSDGDLIQIITFSSD